MQQETDALHTEEIQQVTQTTCCIVGAGPAGAVLALLLARQGIPVMLLEAHMDFDREFRGDTIHPSVLQILDEIGLADRLLQIRHTAMRVMRVGSQGNALTFADFSRFKTKFPYIAVLPQAKFLEFITTEAKQYPEFQLVMGAQVDELIVENGNVCGVYYRGQQGRQEIRAVLTVGTDGRFSRIRRLAGFEAVKTSPPMDILWFRLSHKPGDPEEMFGRFGKQAILVVLNRDEYWQLGYVIPKGHYQQVRAQGLEKLRQIVSELAPNFVDRVAELQEWKQVSVLSVESSFVPRWYRPGLLLIGDAAHVMSPVGGVGINYAIQDAVVTANLLSKTLKYGVVPLRTLAEIQRQRALPTKLIQGLQNFAQQSFLASALNSAAPRPIPPFVRFLLRLPLIRTLPSRIVAFGIWPVHVKE